MFINFLKNIYLLIWALIKKTGRYNIWFTRATKSIFLGSEKVKPGRNFPIQSASTLLISVFILNLMASWLLLDFIVDVSLMTGSIQSIFIRWGLQDLLKLRLQQALKGSFIDRQLKSENTTLPQNVLSLLYFHIWTQKNNDWHQTVQYSPKHIF